MNTDSQPVVDDGSKDGKIRDGEKVVAGAKIGGSMFQSGIQTVLKVWSAPCKV